jgi:dipeptidyl-peptidase 4
LQPRPLPWLFGLLAGLVGLVSASPAAAQAPPDKPAPNFLRELAETRNYALGRPTRIKLSPDGKTVLFLRSPPRQPNLAIYEMDVATGQTKELVTPAQLLGGAEEKLSVAEKARRERMRIVDRGFVSYDLSEDGQRLLFPLSGKLYVYERATGKVRTLGGGDPPVLDPRFSPDGRQVAYVRANDLYVADVASGKERRLTRGGTDLLTHGVAEFIAQEEMGRFEGYFWSPDSRALAYTEVDQSGLEKFVIADPTHPEQPASTFPYPRPGQGNAKVRLGIMPAAGGRTVWVRWDAEKYPYLARVLWKEKQAPLSILVQTRDQREQALLAVDPRTGATRPLWVDKDDAWVELDEDLPRWLPDGSGFLVVSERSGRRELELHKPDGSLERVVFSGADGFHELAEVSDDSSRAYVLSAQPTSTRLWQVGLRKPGAVPLTDDRDEHAVVFARRAPVYVDIRTAPGGYPTATVSRQEQGQGERWVKGAVLPSVAETAPFKTTVQLTSVDTGGRRFHAAVVRPRAFQKGKRYPVVVSVYGGPSALTVRADERAYLLAQWMADHGVVVVSIDNRGTPRRDRAWSRAIKGDFGQVPLDDQVAALKALGARLPELDLGRVGIYGWSYGGFMSALAVMRRPDVFKVAVAGAPVVDWRDYDTHYTERYLDLPQANPKGYEASNLLTYAAKLDRPLLLIHGTTDDNVYFFHSLKLAAALFRAGRRFEFLPLTVTHQVPDPVVREQLWSRIVEFLLRGLRQ